jgi:hypothetical protein
MSAPPTNKFDIFNTANFGISQTQNANQAQFPTLQGMLTAPFGITWGDGSYQNTASGGGGGSGVQNPMTSNLDAGGFSITNVDTFSGLFGNFGEVTTEAINDSAAVIYRDKGAVAAGNYYYVGELPVMTDAEASCIVVSRCLDAGFKQTIVLHVSMFNGKAHMNLISNAVESDTPIFTLCSAGDDGLGSGGFTFFCNHPSTTWEYRVYRQQDDKGTGIYPNGFFNFAPGGAVATTAWTVTYTELDTSAHGSSAVSGSFFAKTSVTTGVVTASSGTINSLTTGSISAVSGPAGIAIQDFIQFPGQDSILNAGEVQVNNISPSTALGIIGIGAVGNRTLYVDTNNRRVGINVPNPSEDLEIDGNIQIDSAGANKIKFYDGAATVERAEIDAAASGTSGGKLVFYTKQDPGVITARMTLEEDGRVIVTNRIESVSNPINAQDAATKDYVDNAIISPGYVQNPMTSNLDGGQFNITNLVGLSVDNTTSGGPNSVSFNLVGSGSVFEAKAASLIKLGGSTIFTDPLRISGITDEVEIGQFNDGATTTTCVSVEHNASRAITTFNEAQYFNHNDPDAHETFPYTFFRDVVTTNITSLQQDGPDLRFAPNNINGQVEMPEIKLPPTANPATFRNIGVVRTDNITTEDPIVTVDGVVAGATKVVEVGGQCAGLLCGFQAIGGTGDYALPYSIPGIGWDNSDDGAAIKLFPLETPFRNQGLTPGTLNYYVTSEYPPNSYYTGFSLVIQVQWIAVGGATVDLCYGNSGGAFNVVEANVLTNPGFNIQRQLSKNDWISIPFMSADSFFLRLNIPPGAQIDAQEGNNRGCLQFVPFYKSLLVVD